MATALDTHEYSGFRLQLSDPEYIKIHGFDIARRLSVMVNRSPDATDVHELVLRARENRQYFGSLAPVIDSLVRQQGLFPYLEADSLSFSDRFAYEAHRPDNFDPSIVFHKVQARVYYLLLRGISVALSAPTSFGKSLVIDALIASGKYKNVAIVVPTISLIDETRRRLVERFGRNFTIITHASQTPGQRNIFVVTPERVPDIVGIERVDFFAIDEFYKLDPGQEPERSPALNEALYRLLSKGAQFYLLGPNIEGVPSAFRDKFPCQVIRTDYATVITEVIQLDVPDDHRLDKVVELCETLVEPTMIYCASPDSARAVVKALSEKSKRNKKVSPVLQDAMQWAANEYHPEWGVVTALGRGIGLHHGKMPRALNQFMVRSFDSGDLNTLVCTSTLIEGVNTQAKNVIIFDHTIARRKLDYFTFSNIKGRSGRMKIHFTGRVYVFDDPPVINLPEVDIPLATQTATASDSLLIQLSDKDLSEDAKARIRPFFEQSLLPMAVLRANRGIDPSAQLRLAEFIRNNATELWTSLSWTIPRSDQLYTACELIWDYLVPSNTKDHGAVSSSQLAFKIDRFRSAQNVKDLIEAEINNGERSSDPDTAVEDTLDFLRYWAGYHFPRYLMALNRIQQSIFADVDLPSEDYSNFANQVENFFAPPGIAALDEYGIPLQTALKLSAMLGSPDDLDSALEALRHLKVEEASLGPFEHALVEDAKRYI
jgi:hypothetical protein